VSSLSGDVSQNVIVGSYAFFHCDVNLFSNSLIGRVRLSCTYYKSLFCIVCIRQFHKNLLQSQVTQCKTY